MAAGGALVGADMATKKVPLAALGLPAIEELVRILQLWFVFGQLCSWPYTMCIITNLSNMAEMYILYTQECYEPYIEIHVLCLH